MLDPASLVNTQTGLLVPAATIRQLFTRQLGVPTVSAKFRVTDTSLVPRPVLPDQADPADVSRFVLADSSAKVSHDSNNPVPRRLTFTMQSPTDLGADIPFPFTPGQDLLQALQTYTVGGLTVEIPKGYFCDLEATEQINPRMRTYQWTGQGLMSLVNKKLAADWCVIPGYPGGYVQALKDLLTCDSVPLGTGSGTGQTPSGIPCSGPGIPADRLAIDQAGNIPVLFPLYFAAGTELNQAVAAIIKALTYYPICDDSRGIFRAQQKWDYTQGLPPFDWDFSSDPAISILTAPIGRTVSNPVDSRGWNQVTVVGETTANAQVQVTSAASGSALAHLSSVEGLHPGDSLSLSAGSASETRIAELVDRVGLVVTLDTTLSASYTGGTATYHPSFVSVMTNDNPNSRVSTVNQRSLGGGPRVLPYYERNNLIASQDACELRARILLQLGDMVTDTLTVSALYMPLIEHFDRFICGVRLQNGTLAVDSSARSLFECQSWDLPLSVESGARMTMKLQRSAGS